MLKHVTFLTEFFHLDRLLDGPFFRIFPATTSYTQLLRSYMYEQTAEHGQKFNGNRKYYNPGISESRGNMAVIRTATAARA